jgi:hypothetical protein
MVAAVVTCSMSLTGAVRPGTPSNSIDNNVMMYKRWELISRWVDMASLLLINLCLKVDKKPLG